MYQPVLIINPDPLITSEVATPFHEAGFKLYQTSCTEEGFQLIHELSPAFIILDLDFIRFKAFDFCRTLRIKLQNWTPLILMSEQDEEFDLVLGLELGADDFIRKPIRPKELVARVKSILRRQSLVWPKPAKEGTNNEEIIINGDLKICPANYTVYVKNKVVELSLKEFEIILHLSRNKGKAVSRDELLSVVGEEQFHADYRIIDVFISRIREKIEPCRSKPCLIKTVRGVGYIMVEH